MLRLLEAARNIFEGTISTSAFKGPDSLCFAAASCFVVAAAAGGAVKAGAQQGAKADIVSLGKGARQGYRDEARKQRRLKKKPKPKPKAKEHFSDNVKKALSNVKDEKPVKKKEFDIILKMAK